ISLLPWLCLRAAAKSSKKSLPRLFLPVSLRLMAIYAQYEALSCLQKLQSARVLLASIFPLPTPTKQALLMVSRLLVSTLLNRSFFTSKVSSHLPLILLCRQPKLPNRFTLGQILMTFTAKNRLSERLRLLRLGPTTSSLLDLRGLVKRCWRERLPDCCRHSPSVNK